MWGYDLSLVTLVCDKLILIQRLLIDHVCINTPRSVLSIGCDYLGLCVVFSVKSIWKCESSFVIITHLL